MNETIEQVDITTGEVTEIAQGDVPAVVKPAATMPEAPRKPRRGSARGDDLRTVSEITGALAAITAAIGVVPKTGENKFHNYKFASKDDVLGKVTPLLAKHGIVIFQTEIERTMFDDGRVLTVQYEFTVAHRSGEVWPDRPRKSGACRCRDHKGGWDDKAFNKCASTARKYFLMELFQIVSGDKEAEADSTSPDTEADADDIRQGAAPKRNASGFTEAEAAVEPGRTMTRLGMRNLQKTPHAAPQSADSGVAEVTTPSAPEEADDQSGVPASSGEFSEAEIVAAERDRLEAAADNGVAALKAAWFQVPVKFHRELEHAKDIFKAKAAEADRKRGQVNY